MIISSVVFTNLLPYAVEAAKFIWYRCCKRDKKTRGGEFNFEEKYATILMTLYICFNFGFGMPLMFVYILIPVFCLGFIDRFLIVYWFKPVVLQTDALNRLFRDLLKYGAAFYLVFAAYTITRISYSWCDTARSDRIFKKCHENTVIPYSTSWLNWTYSTGMTWTLMISGVAIIVGLLLFDFYSRKQKEV